MIQMIYNKIRQSFTGTLQVHRSTVPQFHSSTLWLLCIILLCLPQLSCTKRLTNVYPFDKSYYNETTLLRDMKQMAKDNAGFVEFHTIGTTLTDDKPINVLQIQTDMDRIPILIVGQHHGDEVVGVEIAMAFARQLINAKHDNKLTQLLDTYSFWIMPTLNPEAYAVVTSGKNEWKRKNNTDTNHNGKLDIKTDGVDLNRNYPTFWKLDKPQPESSFFYKGVFYGSEQETQAIVELASAHHFKYAFFYHSSVTGLHSEKIFLPWQDKQNASAKSDFAAMRNIAGVYASATPRDYTHGFYEVYSGNTSKVGNSRNHFYHEYGTYAFDIEVCGKNKSGLGIVHPLPEVRDKIVQKNVMALIKTLAFAL